VVEGESSPTAAEADSDAFERTAWKSPDVSTVIGYDPFALPAAFPRPAAATELHGGPGGTAATSDTERASQLADTVANLRTKLEELRQRGVHVIVKQQDQYVAIVGDRTIHVGDEINGFTVTAIEPDGVQVEWKEQQ
jgi:hypothetical protein